MPLLLLLLLILSLWSSLLLPLFRCPYWSGFFLRQKVKCCSKPRFGKFLRRCYSLHFLRCSHCSFADLLIMQIYLDFHPWHENMMLLVASVSFVFHLDIQRFKRIKRNIFEIFLQPLIFFCFCFCFVFLLFFSRKNAIFYYHLICIFFSYLYVHTCSIVNKSRIR